MKIEKLVDHRELEVLPKMGWDMTVGKRVQNEENMVVLFVLEIIVMKSAEVDLLPAIEVKNFGLIFLRLIHQCLTMNI